MTYIRNRNIEDLSTVNIDAVLNNGELLIRDLKTFPAFAGEVFPAFSNLAASPSPTAMTSGRLWGIHFIIKEDKIITGVKFSVSTAGVYTASDVNGLSLYRDVAGVLTKVSGAEIVDGDFWKTLGTNTRAFTTPITLVAGSYKLCFLWNASATTTAPSINNICSIYAGIANIVGDSEKLSASLAGVTVFPTSAFTAGSLTTNQNILPAFWLY